MEWVNTIGLFCDLIGVIVLSYGLIISEKSALELGVSRLSGSTDNANRKLPAVKDRIKQSRNAAIGMFFLVLGFSLQIIGSWAK